MCTRMNKAMLRNDCFPQSPGNLFISRQWNKYFNYAKCCICTDTYLFNINFNCVLIPM